MNVFENSEIDPVLASRLHDRLGNSRVGLRWERILRSHAHEIASIVAVHADVRTDIADALSELATTTEIDERTVSRVSRVLDDLERLGGTNLRRDVEGLRDDLSLARGHSFEQVLAPSSR